MGREYRRNHAAVWHGSTVRILIVCSAMCVHVVVEIVFIGHKSYARIRMGRT